MTATRAKPEIVDPVSNELRAAWEANDIVVLWESENGALPESTGEVARHWAWQTLRPIMQETAKITLPSIIERRVMQLVNKSIRSSADATSGLLNAAMQALMPGEHARPHRHSMHA